MKRSSLMQGDQPVVQRVQKDLVNSLAEDSFSEEDCQIVFIKPALVPYVDESFENLEVNNNSEEVSDEIDNSIVFLEDEQQSQSRSSEFDSQDMTISHDRNKKANVFKAPSRKRVSMQSFPIREKFKKGPSKFEKKFDSTLLDRFLGARCDKNRRKDKLKKTFVDEEITFKFKRPDRKLEVSEQGTDIGESSQKDFVDLTLDDGKESPFQHNHLYPSGPESLKLFQLSEPQNNQVANEVSKNVLVNNLTSPCSDKSSPLNPSISEVLDRPENEKNPMISVTDVCKDSDVFQRLVKNPMIIVTDLCKDSNFDATKNIRDLSENVVHSYDDENTKTCANSPLTIFIRSLNLEGEEPLVTDEPITQKPLNEDQENDILVQKSTDLEELYATAFNELEV